MSCPSRPTSTSIARWPATFAAALLTFVFARRSTKPRRTSRPDMHILNRIARKSISRRDFLRVSGGLGVGLMVGFDVRAQGSGAASVMRAAGVQTVDATGFVKIAPDNTVTVMIKHLEMGQGPYTGLATLVAEELDADWAQMRAEGAPANNDLYKNLAFGIQGTGGSTRSEERRVGKEGRSRWAP